VKHRVQAPLEETAADYRIDVRDGDGWRTVAREEGNYQRHRVLRFEPARTDAVRIVFERTHGAEQVRIYEARVY
jgi:hypothetical protein